MVKTNAAMNNSHGTSRAKIEFEVLSSRTLPMPDPTKLATDIKSRNLRLVACTVSRYTQAEATDPGRSTSDAVAFAWTGAMPARSSAGKARKVPPPASALAAPPRKAAANRTNSIKGEWVNESSRAKLGPGTHLFRLDGNRPPDQFTH